MKTRVPPELDTLMWTLVEEGNEKAVAEFLERHPEYGSELGRRGSMVKGLRKMRPERESGIASPPPFRPRQTYSTPPMSRRTLVVVGVLVLAALGVASFTASYYLMPSWSQKVERPAQPTNETPDVQVFDESMTKPPEEPEANTTPGPDDEPPVNTTTTGPKPISIAVDEAPLSTVLELIGAQAGIEVVLAPGMSADPVISIDYDGKMPIEILQELGKEHGFTAFDQGDGTVMIVPNPSNTKDEAVPSSSASTAGSVRSHRSGQD